ATTIRTIQHELLDREKTRGGTIAVVAIRSSTCPISAPSRESRFHSYRIAGSCCEYWISSRGTWKSEVVPQSARPGRPIANKLCGCCFPRVAGKKTRLI